MQVLHQVREETAPKAHHTGYVHVNKKVRKFRYNSVCKKMKLKYIAGSEFKTGEEDQWPKHKKYEGKKEDN